eukprot:gene17982-24388_t
MDWESWGRVTAAFCESRNVKVTVLRDKSFASVSPDDPDKIIPQYMLMDWIVKLKQRLPASTLAALGDWTDSPGDGLTVSQLETLAKVDQAYRMEMAKDGYNQIRERTAARTERTSAVIGADASQQKEFLDLLVQEDMNKLRPRKVGDYEAAGKKKLRLREVGEYEAAEKKAPPKLDVSSWFSALEDFDKMVRSTIIIQRAFRAYKSGSAFEVPSDPSSPSIWDDTFKSALKKIRPVPLYMDQKLGGYNKKSPTGRPNTSEASRRRLKAAEAMARRMELDLEEQQRLEERERTKDTAANWELKMAKARLDAEEFAKLGTAEKLRR